MNPAILDPVSARTRIAALREQAQYLLSPDRRTGPSASNPDTLAAAQTLADEADLLDEQLYWQEARRIMRTNPYIQHLSFPVPSLV